jgi:hypothetical protein
VSVMGLVTALISGVVSFLVSLIAGSLGIYVGARAVTEKGTPTEAVVTAIVGALAWAFFSFFLGFIPVVGFVAPLFAYLTLIKWQYGTGWTGAAGIAVVAWVTVLVVGFVLTPVIGPFEGFGVPGI